MKGTTARVARMSLRLSSVRKGRTAHWEAVIRHHVLEEPTPMRRPWSKLKSVVTAREGSTVPMKAREFQVYLTYERLFFDDSIIEVFSFLKVPQMLLISVGEVIIAHLVSMNPILPSTYAHAACTVQTEVKRITSALPEVTPTTLERPAVTSAQKASTA